MIVYSYDQNTLKLTGVCDAFESPLEPGVYHIPADATQIAPPEFDYETQDCRFIDGEWVVSVAVVETPDKPTKEDLVEAECKEARALRDAELARADIMLNRVQDGETGIGTQKAWRAYRVCLRNWPSTKAFPEVFPVAPDAI